MTTLYDATRPVKTNQNFGRGILASRPVYRDEVSIADREWAAANLNADAADYDLAADSPAWDVMAEDAAQRDALCNGCLPL